MRKFYSGLLLLATGILFAGKLNAQITVTASVGVTGPSAYTTLKGAFDAINAGTHRGIINISVTGNTTETAQAVLNSSGTGSAVYTSVNIKPAASTTPTITGNISTGLIKLNGADFVTIDGSNTTGGTTRDLTIFNSSAANGVEVWIGSPSAADGANNNTIKNCILTGAGATVGIASVLSGSGVTFGGQGLTSNSNNTLENNLITNNQNGTFLSGVGSAPFDQNWVIKNNTIAADGVRGILIQFATNFEISGNTITGMSNAAFVNPVVGILAGGSLNGGNIFNNSITGINAQITNAASYGIQINTGSTASVNIYNNFISGVYSSNGSTVQPELNGHGIAITFPGNGYNIYNNTIVANTSQSSGLASGCFFVINTLAATNSINLRNNNFVNLQTGAVTNRTAVFCGAGSAVFNTIDNNNYFATSGSLGNIGGTNRTTIVQMQTFFGGNTNSVSVNPAFVSGSDFHLQSIFANQALRRGVTISSPAITTDFDGNTRAAVPVMGADETYLPSQITYTPVIPSCGNNNIVLSGVNIQDATETGITNTGGNMPRIYFRKNAGAWFSAAGTQTGGTAFNGTWDFVINASTMGGLAAGNVVEYYVIAQDAAGVVTSNPATGLVATGVNSVTTPPTTPTSFTVNAVPTATLGIAPNPTCEGTPIVLTASSVSGPGTLTSYNWSGPSSFSTTTSTNTTSISSPTTTSAGQYSLTVTYPGDGCVSNMSNVIVTVNAALPSISTTGTVCIAATTTLSNTTGGGTWSSSNTGVATIGATTGVATGVLNGTTTITYQVGACITTTVLTVNANPVAIAGTPSVCEGASTTLTNATPSGTWSSSNSAIASVPVSTAGDVDGIVAGTARITYTIPNGCFTSAIVTVMPLPSIITGTFSQVCEGSTIVLASTPTAGGTWSSSNANATVNASGVVTGVTAGNATITFTRANTCYRTRDITVNVTPTVTSTPATPEVCIGYTIPLTGTPAIGGATWSTSSAGVSVDISSGVVTGTAATTNGRITYTLPTGCRSTIIVTVNTTPLLTTPNNPICVGGTLGMAGTVGGAWTSANATIASVTSGTGLITGNTAGTTNITYTLPNGCYTTFVVTVNALPTTITGGTEVCSGSTLSLASTPTGGTWASSNLSRATVNSSGLLSGISAGTVNITYSVTYPGANTCRTSTQITVNPVPAAITGTQSVCVGSSTTLASATSGGNWSSADADVNIPVATAGNISGVSAGTAVVTYTLPVTGCFRTATVTVNALPAAISGPTALCPGQTASFSNITGGGTWISSTPAVGSINNTTGVAAAIAAGTTTITYRLTATGCIATQDVTVNSTPPAITGPTNVCVGSTVTLANADPGGTWLSTVPSVATIDGAGNITGNAVGTTTVSYTSVFGCVRTRIMTVNTTPAAVSGVLVVCEAATTNLTSTPGGGTWSTADASIATVGATTGVVSGVGAGVVDITYTLGGSSVGCTAIASVTVNPRPLPITGFPSVCIGSITDLDDITPLGTWSSGMATIASVDAVTGEVTGIAAGTAAISYTLGTGCARVQNVVVNPLPVVIGGADAVCVNSNITLTNSTAGGTWSSDNVTVATITSGGVVTGVNAGFANISYILPTGCYRVKSITVNPTPAAIAGPGNVCVGSTVTLVSTAGGTWSTPTTTIATVNPTTGDVYGVAAGSVTVSYTNPEGCRVTRVITVNNLPAVITGPNLVCIGSSITLASATGGGTWTSSDAGVASVMPGTGFVTGVSAGTANISYTNGAGCFRFVTVTVNSVPGPIAGSTPVCAGSTITLTGTPTGGTWSSSATGIATVHSTLGNVTGVAAGTATITYRLSTGCYSTVIVTVDPNPTTLTGTQTVCMGFTTAFTSLTPGGTWSSSNTGVATVSGTGVISTVAPGTSTITYTSTAGCMAYRVVTVQSLPPAIGGSLTVCSGSTTALSNANPGGTWSSSNSAVGTVSATGVVGGLLAGTTAITYTLPTGCFTVSVVTVTTVPATITGTALICSGGNTSTLTSATTPGTWASSNISVATVDPTGLVTSGTTGTSVITYTGANGCFTTRIVTVTLTPSAITGLSTVCQNSTIGLASSPTGGTWSSTTPSVGTVVATTGVVTGVSAGTTTISYTTANGCATSTVINVDPIATLTSPALACVGANITLTYSITGGSWTSGNPTIASVGLTTGVVTGNAAGTANITYALPSGCRTISVVTVNALPPANTGTASVCLGFSTTLSNTTPGIVWSSSNAAIATVGSSTGIVVGTGVGTVDIIGTNPVTGCARPTTVTVNSLPSAITGTNSMCQGNTTTLSSTPLGGTWTSANTSIATAGLSTGVITGVAAGTTTITYRLSTGCFETRTVNVLPPPVALSGAGTTCVGSTTVFFTPTPGGTWLSANTTIAQVGTGGVITGMSPGTTLISYVLGTTCFTTKPVTVLPIVAPITGVTTVCAGSNTALSSLTPGGTWSSSNTSVALVGSTTGLVSGADAGTAIITYTAPTGCTDTAIVTVNPVPSSILPHPNVCLGSTITLSSLTTPGTWSTSNPVIAPIDATTGVVTGGAVGTATITYTIGTGCRTTSTVIVSPLPAAITGYNQVCVGSSTTLATATTGGTWASSNETVAIVGTGGVVSGVAAGTANISYLLPTGCVRFVEVTVNATPNPITGVAEACLGATTTLSATPSGGAFTSSTTSVATIGVTSGVMTGVGVGTSVITYTLPTGCRSFVVATVHAVPAAIGGPTNLCEGGTVTLTNTAPGGVWSSDNIFTATVEPATGVVTGVDNGVVIIRYTLTGGCSSQITVTVNEAPTAITGDFEICQGETTTLTPPTAGGTWSSSNTAVATVGLSSGVVTGVAAGTTNITYSLGAGCRTFSTFVVNPAPSAIVGPHEVCSGQTISLTNTVAGGTWTSTNSSVASVDGTTGVVSGVASGTATVVYQLPGGCLANFIVTVNALPSAIGGLDSVCQGAVATYTSTPTGGIWTSSTPSIAPINLVTGELTAVAVGSSTITYTLLGTGCYRTKSVTVNPVPGPITGTFNVCVGSTTLLSTVTPGGVWTSSNTSVAIVGSATGLVQGLGEGVTTIMNTLPTGCFAAATVVVNPLPANITGVSELCVGSTTPFTSATPFGSWSSSNTSVATVGSFSGNVTGIANGTATITYTLFATGCSVIKHVTVNPLPPTITGPDYMCLGSVSFVTNAIAGGTWSSSASGVVSVDGFGNVTATGLGNATITYQLGSACYITRLITVEPTLNPITGPSSVCEGANITLGNSYVGGIWTSGNTAIATVSGAGVVTGVLAGTVNISYETPNAHCFVFTTVTVDPVPDPIIGTDTVCVGLTAALGDATPGGTWSSSDATIANVDATSGVVTGVAAGTANITYTVGSGCIATLPFRVKAQSNAGTISGPTEVCVTATITLASSGDLGGTWTSADATIASVDGATGVITGVAAGTTIISYISFNDCGTDTATFNLQVNEAPNAGTLTATTAGICIDYTTTVTSTVAGGVWTSNNTAIATVNAAGVVTSHSAGTATISYTVTNGCGSATSTINITVYGMAPLTLITIHPDTVMCANSQYRNFGAALPPTTGVVYTWGAVNAEIYAQSANRQNILVNFPTAGVAYVTLTTSVASTGCFIQDTFKAVIGADSAFTPTVQYYAGELICTDNTASSYQWGYDDVTTLDSTRIFGATQQSYYQPSLDVNKRYWVIAGKKGCFQKVYYEVPTNVGGAQAGIIDVRLFPNPADSRINIEVKGLTANDNITIKLIDMLGREVETGALVNGKGSIDVSKMASGVYSVMFFNNDVKLTAKTFVKN